MSDCCSSSSKEIPKKHRCPLNKQHYSQVPNNTVMHHAKYPWELEPSDKTYYFCTDPDCEVVYFSQDDTTLNKAQLRTMVGIKAKSEDSLICYCFGITYQDAKGSSPL